MDEKVTLHYVIKMLSIYIKNSDWQGNAHISLGISIATMYSSKSAEWLCLQINHLDTIHFIRIKVITAEQIISISILNKIIGYIDFSFKLGRIWARYCGIVGNSLSEKRKHYRGKYRSSLNKKQIKAPP